MTMEDEPLIVAELMCARRSRSARSCPNLVATIGEHDAVVAAHWLRAGHPQPPRAAAQIQERLRGLRETLSRALPHERG